MRQQGEFLSGQRPAEEIALTLVAAKFGETMVVPDALRPPPMQ